MITSNLILHVRQIKVPVLSRRLSHKITKHLVEGAAVLEANAARDFLKRDILTAPQQFFCFLDADLIDIADKRNTGLLLFNN